MGIQGVDQLPLDLREVRGSRRRLDHVVGVAVHLQVNKVAVVVKDLNDFALGHVGDGMTLVIVGVVVAHGASIAAEGARALSHATSLRR